MYDNGETTLVLVINLIYTKHKEECPVRQPYETNSLNEDENNLIIFISKVSKPI